MPPTVAPPPPPTDPPLLPVLPLAPCGDEDHVLLRCPEDDDAAAAGELLLAPCGCGGWGMPEGVGWEVDRDIHPPATTGACGESGTRETG